MLLMGYKRAAACAVLGCVVPIAAGQERGSGEKEIVFATIDMDGLSAAPRYTPGPALLEGNTAQVNPQSQNLVLVPLPAPVWVTASGLTSLALIAAWRRHRLRAE